MSREHEQIERDIHRIDKSLTKHIEVYQKNGKEIARMAQELKDTKTTINDRLDSIAELISSNRQMLEKQGKKYVTKTEMAPVKMLAFGGAGLILTGAITTIMAIVFI